MQQTIDTTIANLKSIKHNGLSYPYGLDQPRSYIPFNPDFPVITSEDDLSSFEDQIIMLASIPKVAINFALASALDYGKITTQPLLDKPALIELIGRKPSHLLNNPVYEPLLQKYPQLKQSESLFNNALNRSNHLNLVKQVKEAVPDDFSLQIDFTELAFQALSLSSNNATRIAKQLITSFGMDFKELVKELVPNYSPSPASMLNLEHWQATLPNCGPIAEHMQLLHNIGTKYLNNELNSTQLMVANALINNSIDFGHDFTNSSLGKDLMKEGCTILEKTGYYPCVFWIKDFVQQPFNYPPHMIMATVFTIINHQQRTVKSYAYQQMYLVKLPTATETKVINNETITVLDDDSDYAASYSEPIKKIVQPIFREKLNAKVKADLN